MAKHTLKIMAVNTARFLKDVRPFLNIMHEKVNRSVQDQLVKRYFLSLWKNIYGGIQLLATLQKTSATGKGIFEILQKRYFIEFLWALSWIICFVSNKNNLYAISDRMHKNSIGIVPWITFIYKNILFSFIFHFLFMYKSELSVFSCSRPLSFWKINR